MKSSKLENERTPVWFVSKRWKSSFIDSSSAGETDNRLPIPLRPDPAHKNAILGRMEGKHAEKSKHLNASKVPPGDIGKRAEELRDRAKLFMEEGKDEGWKNLREHNGIVLYSKSFPDVSPFACAKGHVILKDIQPKDAARIVWEMKDERFKETNPDFGAFETVATVNENLRVYRSVANVPWPLWPRELVFYSYYIEDDEGFWIIQESCKHSSAPHDKTKYVRGTLFLGSFYFTKDADNANNTSFWRFFHFEPKGNVPSFVINAKLDRFISQLEELCSIIQEDK